MRRTLNRDERDVLYRDADLALSALDDVHNQIRNFGGEGAQETADGCRPYMRLLDDIGWERVDSRETYRLTMPDDELEPFMRYLLERAEGAFRDSVDGAFDRSRWHPMSDEKWEEHCVDMRQQIDEDLDLRLACSAVLGTGA
jgi:hypothetical protein